MKKDFPWTEAEFREMTREAVRSYWKTREGQQSANKSGKSKDAGTRGAVTGGKHLDGLSALVEKVILAAGFEKKDIHFGHDLVLPGYYRAQKMWDIIVARDGRLHAAIELKSQSGSFGNNQNNRIEEVLGLARDFWVAYREKAFGGLDRPWIGYAFILEDSAKSRKVVKIKKSPFPASAVFDDTNYAQRYAIACERLVLERDYDATALVLSSPKTPGDFDEPAAAHSLYTFCRALYRRLRAEA